MAWSSPPTFTSGAVLTAAQQNILSDDLRETAAAKATTSGRYFVATAANTLAERAVGETITTDSETTTSTTYGDLATVGPAVTVTSGVLAMVCVSAQMSNNSVSNSARMSFAVSGASTISANDNYSCLIANPSGETGIVLAASFWTARPGLTAGSNTFTAKYRVSGGTGTFLNRRIAVFPY